MEPVSLGIVEKSPRCRKKTGVAHIARQPPEAMWPTISRAILAWTMQNNFAPASYPGQCHCKAVAIQAGTCSHSTIRPESMLNAAAPSIDSAMASSTLLSNTS